MTSHKKNKPEQKKIKKTPQNNYYLYRNIQISKLMPKKTKGHFRGGMGKGK